VTRPLRVVTVCMGNICRSPTAEVVLREKLAEAGLAGRVEVDSAGTYGGHAGEPPDPRSQAAALRRGYDLSALRARRLGSEDAAADLLLVMDRGNLRRTEQVVGEHAGLSLFLATPAGGAEVPDPYGGGAEGFERVLDLIELGADEWVVRIGALLASADDDTKAPPGGSGT
jgi:protein-tyrosine phosphatase